jgi:hypothetical protein
MKNFYGIHVAVKYHGPTNFRGSRYSAKINCGGSYRWTATVDYDYEQDTYGNQLAAVEAVAQKSIETFRQRCIDFDGFEVIAATVDNFIIELTTSEELAAQ